MAKIDWMERFWVEIDDIYSGHFAGKFDDPQRAQATWKRAILRKLPAGDKQRAARALRKTMDMIPHECPHPPVLADVLALLDEALAETRRETAAEARYPTLAPHPGGNPMLAVIDHVERHSEPTPIAVEEISKIRRLLAGEPVEQAIGKTLAQHAKELDDYGRKITEAHHREIMFRQRTRMDQ